MVKYIAHRGNWDGPSPDNENTKEYLYSAYFDKGFGVEVDIILYNDELYYGHDEPQERVITSFLLYPDVFCHAKDLNALGKLLDIGANCFWHQEDTVTLTSENHIWCYPGHFPKHERAVWLNLHGATLPKDTTGIYGICGDKNE
tara:strand:+ start:827 stop:1258 length:432 start_codon:yes stop_codon:yes gene_type:complete